MANSHSSSVTASEFVQQYYDVLEQQPEFVHLFYTASSTMIRVDTESTETASDISQIYTLVQSLHFSEIEIKTTNSVGSWNEGITVVVSGLIKSDRFTGSRNFVETFCLVPKDNEKGYLIMNDIFHFVSEEDLSGVVYAKDFIDILYIKREHGETIEDFTYRFIKETSHIPGASDDLKMTCFIHGVRNDELFRKLINNYPQTVAGMIHQVKDFVREERAHALLKDVDTRPNDRKRKRYTRARESMRPYRPRRHPKISFPGIRTNDFQEGPLVITARVDSHCARTRTVHWRSENQPSLKKMKFSV